MKKFVFHILIFSLVLLSCKKDKEVQTQTYALPDFTELEFNSYFQVFLIQGDENSLRVEAAKKRLDDLTWEVDGQTLKFKSKGKFSWTKPGSSDIKLYITLKDLRLLKANQTCDIKTMNTLSGDEIGIIFADKLNDGDLDLNYNTIYYWNNFPCGGKLTLSGTCTYLKIWNFALMQVDATQLITQHALIENSSKGSCSAYVIQSLNYAIKGEGDILLFSNPGILPALEVSDASGSGKLEIHN